MRSCAGRHGFLLILIALLAASTAGAAEYCATYGPYSPSALPTLLIGQTYTVKVTVTNCGTNAWDSSFLLGNHWAGPVADWDDARAAIVSGQPTSITVRAPSTPGTYTLQWDVINPVYLGGIGWFSNPTASVPPVTPGQQTVKVENLCASLYCGKLIAVAMPNLGGIVAPTPRIEPDGVHILYGTGFGMTSGKVKITLPSGKLASGQVMLWTDRLIFTKVPAISGEVDGTSQVQIETSGHLLSNKVSVPFVATRDVVTLPWSRFQGSCADPWGSWDYCHPFFAASFGAGHYSACCFSGDDDTDVFWTTDALVNGWLVKDYKLEDPSVFNDPDLVNDGNYNVSSFSAKGATTAKIVVDWSNPLWGFLDYWGYVTIVGPKGVAYAH